MAPPPTLASPEGPCGPTPRSEDLRGFRQRQAVGSSQDEGEGQSPGVTLEQGSDSVRSLTYALRHKSKVQPSGVPNEPDLRDQVRGCCGQELLL